MNYLFIRQSQLEIERESSHASFPRWPRQTAGGQATTLSFFQIAYIGAKAETFGAFSSDFPWPLAGN